MLKKIRYVNSGNAIVEYIPAKWPKEMRDVFEFHLNIIRYKKVINEKPKAMIISYLRNTYQTLVGL